MTPLLHISALDLWTSAQTAWGEARNQGEAGITAVLCVIRNRHEWHPRWRGRAIAAICQAPARRLAAA